MKANRSRHRWTYAEFARLPSEADTVAEGPRYCDPKRSRPRRCRKGSAALPRPSPAAQS